MSAISRYGHADLPTIRQILLDVHADAYATEMHDPFHQTEKFAWFVDHWGARPSFDCVIAFDTGQPAGFAYGATAALGRETWREHLSPWPCAAGPAVSGVPFRGGSTARRVPPFAAARPTAVGIRNLSKSADTAASLLRGGLGPPSERSHPPVRGPCVARTAG
ncbi:hypothetical protein ACIQCQ_39265 [Streptomyces sp. NPDC088394]|uniref:hypothetical protein n=1 Tax=unclassified Streptomyces TaxID=2593676 RepID=UPI00340A46FA